MTWEAIFHRFFVPNSVEPDQTNDDEWDLGQMQAFWFEQCLQ